MNIDFRPHSNLAASYMIVHPGMVSPPLLISFTRSYDTMSLAEARFALRHIVFHLDNIFHEQRRRLQRQSFMTQSIPSLSVGDNIDYIFYHFHAVLLHEILHLLDVGIDDVGFVHPLAWEGETPTASRCHTHTSLVSLAQLMRMPHEQRQFQTVSLTQFREGIRSTEAYGPFNNAESITRAILSIYVSLVRPELNACPKAGDKIM